MGPVGRMQSHGAAAGTQLEFAGSRWDILQDILRGYPAVNDSRYPMRISYRMYASSSQDILQGYLIQDILLGYPIGYLNRISSELILVTYLGNLSVCSG
jgi:hypothetical protein